VLIDV
jgi:hypothetical protein